jgi:hypothetical protein
VSVHGGSPVSHSSPDEAAKPQAAAKLISQESCCASIKKHRILNAPGRLAAYYGLLASGHQDGTILIWGARSAGEQKERRAGKIDAPQLEQWCADLGGEDASRAFAAVCGLSEEPAHVVRLFRDRLRPATEGPPDRLRQLIADLDSPQFQQRETARQQLTALEDQAVPALRAALRANPPLEQRRRIEQILDALRVVRAPETLRSVRAVEVLERIGNAEARAVLEKLAKGVAEARLTREAQASLMRLARRPTDLP